MKMLSTRRLRFVFTVISVVAAVSMVSSTAYSRSWHSPARHHRSPHCGVVVRGNDAAAIIAAGILVGVTFSLIDSALNAPVRSGTTAHQPVYNSGHTVNYATGSVMVTAQMLNVRSGPGLGNPAIRQIPNGTVLSVQGSEPGWYYVKTSDNLYGWVMVQYTTPMGYPASG